MQFQFKFSGKTVRVRFVFGEDEMLPFSHREKTSIWISIGDYPSPAKENGL